VIHTASALGIGCLPAPQLPARAAKDFVFFAAAQTTVLSAAKPEDIGFAGGDPMPPTMSPLRAVVSRGHIAENLLTAAGAGRAVFCSRRA